MKNDSVIIKRICHSVFAAFLIISALTYALPVKRLIIQLSHELSGQDEITFRQQLDQLVLPKHTLTLQGSRWLLGLPSETSSEQLQSLIADISAIDVVSFVEEDKIIKHASAPPVVNTQ